MPSTQSHYRIKALVFAAVAVSFSTFAQEMPKIPTLDNYPKPVVEHLLGTFNVEREKLSGEGVPQAIDDLPQWCACPPEQENAFPIYQSASEAEVLSERLNLLARAAALPCFEYPLARRRPENLFIKSYSIDFDLYGEMRDTTRILVDEARIRLTSGDTDGAIDMLYASFGLLDHMTQLPASLVQLTRYACQELVMGAFRDVLASATLDQGLLKRLAEAVDRAKVPDQLARTWLFEGVFDSTTVPFQSTETIHIFDGVARAQLDAARTAIAAERFIQANGKIPESLADLVPEYLDSIPVDPMIGAPLRFESNDTHLAVYSVGMDGEPLADPFAWTQDDSIQERTVVLLPLKKSTVPLQEMDLSFTHESRPNTGEELEAMHAVSDSTISSLFDYNPRIVSFSAGTLDDGIAVLLASVTPDEEGARTIPIMAGFWYKDATIYTVNAAARAMMPQLSSAPAAVTFSRLRDAVH